MNAEAGSDLNRHFAAYPRLSLPLGRSYPGGMARPPRIDFADAVYHVTSRGSGRAKVTDRRTKVDFAHLIREVVDED